MIYYYSLFAHLPKYTPFPTSPPPGSPKKGFWKIFKRVIGDVKMSPPPPPALGCSPICQIFFEVLQGGPPVLNSPSLFKTAYLKKKKTRTLQHFRHIANLHFLMTDISVTRRAAKINRLSLKSWSHLL